MNQLKPKVEDIKSIISVRVEQNIVLQGDPLKQIEFARVAAKALMDVIESKPKKVIIGGETYLEFEDWMMLARFWGATVGVEWTKPIISKERVVGYEARAIVSLKGEVVSSAEAMCTRDERNWANREEFMLRSMAQTRASAKALRNVFAWVATMAGYKGTPAEEIQGTSVDTSVPILDLDSDPTVQNAKQHDNLIDLKKRIMLLINRIEMRNVKDKAEIEHLVKQSTELDLLPENYQEISNRLDVLWSEQQSIQKK